jgi:hypothetical protein
VITKLRGRGGHSLSGAAEPEKIINDDDDDNNNNNYYYYYYFLLSHAFSSWYFS